MVTAINAVPVRLLYSDAGYGYGGCNHGYDASRHDSHGGNHQW